MKKIQIVYLPGFGGNFLESLFSLDPVTQPCMGISTANDTPSNRIDCYVKKLQEQSIVHWGDLINNKSSNGNYPVLVQSIHPQQFSFDDEDIDRFLVDLSWSNFANYWLITSRQNFGYQIARIATDEIDKQIRIKKKYDPTLISLDAFLDPATWMDEYIRVSQLMELSYYPAAEKLYRLWYNIRVRAVREKFVNIDSLTKVSVCRARLEENVYGAPTNWNIFYENIRDPSWPNCRSESDFENLPARIKAEIINDFNYVPLAIKN
jgi:hypothetical protein